MVSKNISSNETNMTNVEGNNRKWTQDEIINNTKNVVRGLETLKNEHSGILNNLKLNSNELHQSDGETELEKEKGSIIQESIEKIELGLGEAQVRIDLFCVRDVIPSLNGVSKYEEDTLAILTMHETSLNWLS